MRRAEVYYQNRLAGIITEHEEGYKPVGGIRGINALK